MIPYIISIACPDYKRPRISMNYGSCDSDNFTPFRISNAKSNVAFFLNEKRCNPNVLLQILVKLVLEQCGYYCYDTYEKLIENYYNDGYMDNFPFTCNYVMDEKWHELIYSHEEFMQLYKSLNDGDALEDDYTEDDYTEDDYTEDDILNNDTN